MVDLRKLFELLHERKPKTGELLFWVMNWDQEKLPFDINKVRVLLFKIDGKPVCAETRKQVIQLQIWGFLLTFGRYPEITEPFVWDINREQEGVFPHPCDDMRGKKQRTWGEVFQAWGGDILGKWN